MATVVLGAAQSACDSSSLRGDELAPRAEEPIQVWRMTAEPLLEIGDLDGPEAIARLGGLSQSAGAIALGADLLPDGRIVVADGGRNEVRIYDPDGSRRAAVGRTGDGPGEFRELAGVKAFAGGDSLMAWEASTPRRSGLRLTVLETSSGEVARTIVVRDTEHTVVLGVADDGSVMAREPAVTLLTRRRSAGVARDPVTVRRFSSDGRLLGEYGPFADQEYFFAPPREIAIIVPGRTTVMEVGRHHLLAGDNQEFAVSLIPIDGVSPAGYLHRDHVAVELPDSLRQSLGRMLSELRQRSRSPTGGGGTSVDVPIPESYPAFFRIVEDAEGNVWVGEWPTGGEQHWWIFDSGGSRIAELRTMLPVTVVEVGSSTILAAFRDQLGVSYLRLYGIERPPD